MQAIFFIQRFAALVVVSVCTLTVGLSLASAQQQVTVNYDGKSLPAIASPDGKRVVFSVTKQRGKNLFVANADGTQASALTRNRGINYAPCWSPDGKRIAFCSTQKNGYQIFEIDSDGENSKQITDHKNGARSPKYSPNGKLAYLLRYPRDGKSQPADLVIHGDKLTKVIENVDIMDFAWSHDGKKICIGTANKLSFYELETRITKIVDVYEIDDRLYAHGPRMITWSPDDKKIACRIRFLGGRSGGTSIYGDTELFVISEAGKMEAIDAKDIADRTEDWITSKFGND